MASEAARKAVAEKLKFEPEVAGCIQLEDGLRIFSRPAVEAFNLCVSLQERVDVLEKALIWARSVLSLDIQPDAPVLVAIDAALSPKEGVK